VFLLALLVDYILISRVVARAPTRSSAWCHLVPALKVPTAVVVLILITASTCARQRVVTALMPIFLIFLGTHAVLIVGGILTHSSRP